MRDMVEAGFVDTGSLELGRSTQLNPCDEGASSGTDGARANRRGEVLWRRFGFDHGGNTYGFETTSKGDRARVVINGKAALELPHAVWGALLDALALQHPTAVPFTAAARHVHVRETSGPPASSGRTLNEPQRGHAAWDDIEDDQLQVAWTSGAQVPELAVLHRRSHGAILARLEKLGLNGPQRHRVTAPQERAASP